MSSTPKTPKSSDKPDSYLDQTLRPKVWDEYIGQKNIKDNLNILLQAAKERKQPPEHILFFMALQVWVKQLSLT